MAKQKATLSQEIQAAILLEDCTPIIEAIEPQVMDTEVVFFVSNRATLKGAVEALFISRSVEHSFCDTVFHQGAKWEDQSHKLQSMKKLANLVSMSLFDYQNNDYRFNGPWLHSSSELVYAVSDLQGFHYAVHHLEDGTYNAMLRVPDELKGRSLQRELCLSAEWHDVKGWDTPEGTQGDDPRTEEEGNLSWRRVRAFRDLKRVVRVVSPTPAMATRIINHYQKWRCLREDNKFFYRKQDGLVEWAKFNMPTNWVKTERTTFGVLILDLPGRMCHSPYGSAKIRQFAGGWVCKLGNGAYTITYWFTLDGSSHVEGDNLHDCMNNLKSRKAQIEKRSAMREGIVSLNLVRNDKKDTLSFCLPGTRQWLYANTPHIAHLIEGHESWGEIPEDIMSTEFNLTGEALKSFLSRMK